MRLNKSQILSQLKEIRDISTMRNASFHVGEEPFPFGADVTDLVRQATRLWRESWITGPLDELIKELETNYEQAPGKATGAQS